MARERLIEAAGAIQPNSRQLLALQVGRSLSRIVADRKDRDRRYAKAASAKQTAPRKPGGVMAALMASNPDIARRYAQ